MITKDDMNHPYKKTFAKVVSELVQYAQKTSGRINQTKAFENN